ncbi:MAG: TetR/AcrR family transcriptional regulator [Sporichthyaceae bacterium]
MRQSSQREWFAVAFDVLGSDGPSALTVPALCERMWVTKGSFYHHFGSLPAFTEALAKHWLDGFATVLEENAALADPLRRVEHSTMHTLAIRHEAEAALRAAGRSDRTIGEAVELMDRRRVATLESAVGGIVDPRRVSTVARVGVSLLIGAQQYGQRTDRSLLLEVGLDWLVSSVRVPVRVVTTPHGPPTVHLG